MSTKASAEQLKLALGLEEPAPGTSRTASVWVTPEYSKSQVDRAGRLLVDGGRLDEMEEALKVINNWRSAHSFPLNTFQVTLRRKAPLYDERALVAQRIKRLSSIDQKLARLPTQRLSQMQDIGGCRAVLQNVARVRLLTDDYRNADLKHDLEDVDDYISTPPKSGYRGTHLIYRYRSDKGAQAYNGLLVEVQLRSQLQHAWATAVETVGTFLRQALKASQGHQQWLRFFSLMGTALALRERTPPVPGTPTGPALTQELRHIARTLGVAKRLHSYGAALKKLSYRGSTRDAHYYLLALDPGAEEVWVNPYPKNQLERATADYLTAERTIADRPGAEAVLVSVESISALRRAYPNYFLDTRLFINAVNVAMR